MAPSTSIHSPSRTRLITVSEVRNRSGFQDSSDASDAEVQDAIDDAEAQFMNDEARWLQGVELIGDVDGSNTSFELPDPWNLIADDTLDETIDASDVHVYTEDKSTTPPTRNTQTVTSVDSRFGVITLNTAPSSGVTVHFDGYVIKQAWDINLVKSALKSLASWFLWGQVRDGSEVLTADPTRAEGNDGTGMSGKRHLEDYERAIRALSGGNAFSVASKDRTQGAGTRML